MKFTKLLQKVTEAESKLSEAESTRDEFLNPILTVLGATGGSIDSVIWSEANLHVTRVGSTRGFKWSDDYTFPISIFTAADPIAEAQKYVARQKEIKAEEERASKLAQLHRLQKDLGDQR
jgi:hypothetical protein